MSCYNSEGSGTFTDSTPVPALFPNGTIHYPYQYSQFLDSISRNSSCGGATYLRPDVGGALLPWLYTIIAILIHLPVVIIRAARWERVQILSVALATFTIIITILGYTSTKLAPQKVLVWMPLTLPLDAGSMLQIAVLIIEDVGYRKLGKGLVQKFSFGRKSRMKRSYLLVDDDTGIVLQEYQVNPNKADEESLTGKVADFDVSTKALIAIGAIALFLIIVILQVVGVVYASTGRKQAEGLTVTWCSPIFALFAVAVSDEDCHLYPVTKNSGKGIGCIELPAVRQQGWLLGTMILGSISLVLEACDFFILILVHGKMRWRSIKMKRPWFSMIIGMIVLFILAVFGYNNSTELPQGITESLYVYMQDQSADSLTTCHGIVYPAGLRGAIIGWSDGLFTALKTIYFGSAGGR